MWRSNVCFKVMKLTKPQLNLSLFQINTKVILGGFISLCFALFACFGNASLVRKMEKVHIHILMVMYIMVIGKMIRNMELVNIHGLVVRYMMVNGKMIRNMEKVHIHILVVMYMMVNGNMIREMDMVNSLMQMVLSIMMDGGKIINQ